MSRPLLPTLAALLGLALACGGDLVGSAAFDTSGAVSWSTTVPGDKTSLWLDYTVDAPSTKDGFDDLEAAFGFMGQMTVKSGDQVLYDGPLNLSPEGSPVAGTGSSTRMGTSQTCNSTRCSVTGRIKLLDLSALHGGDPLQIKAHLPARSDDATASGLSLQLYQS